MSEDFGEKLSRWSQRKLAARRGDAPADEVDDAARGVGPSAENAPEAKVAGAPAGETSDEEVPVLPPVDELTAESDYTVFLAKNVPEAIKRAALRKLWVSDPVLANLDRLNDYDEDYSFVDTVVSAVRTSYRVGKGYIDDAEKEPADGEPASTEQASPAEATKPAESPVASADTDGGTSSDTLGANAAVGDESAVAVQRVGEGEPGQGQSGKPKDGA